MGPAYFVLAILGCGEGDAPCQQVAIASTQFASAAACTAETEAAVERYIDVDYPVVVAECRPAGLKFASVRSSDVKRPPAERIPQAQPAAYRPASQTRF
ncbi:MAG: hypothetical protein ACM3YM_03920 [Sphingomonadales bacterium]